MDATSQAQVMALVRYFVSEKQGTRILVMPYTQIRETRRKLDQYTLPHPVENTLSIVIEHVRRRSAAARVKRVSRVT